MTSNGRRPRFFVGLKEVGDYTLMLARGLRALGFHVDHVLLENRSPLLRRSEQADRYIDPNEERRGYDADLAWNLARAIASSDVFVFNYASSFWNPRGQRRPKLDDLRLLRRLGKTVVVVAMGSDLRSWRSMVTELRTAGLDRHAGYIERDVPAEHGGSDGLKRPKVVRIERYARHVFARPNGAQLLTRPYHLLWIPIDLRDWPFDVATSDPPLVVHAPSNSAVKGTRYVLEAVARLREEGARFEFELCENRDHADVKRLLGRSQIVVDQLLLPGYGLFAIEAMAAGNAVIGSAIAGYNGFPEDLPVLSTTPDSLFENLRNLIEEVGERQSLAVRGRDYVERHHELSRVVSGFLDDIRLPSLPADAGIAVAGARR
jgi:glycosyltransferase involved in cell wall biosynthesis